MIGTFAGAAAGLLILSGLYRERKEIFSGSCVIASGLLGIAIAILAA